MGVCEQISVLAGSPSMASIWTEAMRQRKLSPKRLLPTLPGHRLALRRSANLRNIKLLDTSCPAYCKPDSSLYSASTTVAV